MKNQSVVVKKNYTVDLNVAWLDDDYIRVSLFHHGAVLFDGEKRYDHKGCEIRIPQQPKNLKDAENIAVSLVADEHLEAPTVLYSTSFRAR